jgi:hypothetical protein
MSLDAAPLAPPAGGPPAPWVRRSFLVLVLASFVLRLAYASVDLTYGRFYDEKYVMANVHSALASDDFRPANGYYASLSWTPQALLIGASHLLWKATGIEVFRVLGSQYPEMTPTAFFLARLLQVVFGVGVLCLTYRLGREVFSPEVGLLAALLLAVMPNQIRLSAFFKPDIAIAMLAPAVILLTLAAARRPSRGRFVWVGVVVGLATAAKYTGATLGLPLALVALVLAWQSRRRGDTDRAPDSGLPVTARMTPASSGPRQPLVEEPAAPQPRAALPAPRLLFAWTVMAGVASVATFVAVNPHLAIVLSFLPALGEIYETKGARAGGTHLTVIGDAFEILLSPTQHGLLLGLVALAGGALLVRQLLDRRQSWRRRLELALVLAVPATYIAAYAVATNIAKANNFLHVTPFTALWAGWLLWGVWERLRSRWAIAARPLGRRLATAGWAVATAILTVPAVAYCLDPVIPTAQTQAETTLLAELQPLAHRHLVRERGTPRLELQDRLGLAMQSEVADLGALDPAALDLFDAELFAASRLGGEQGAFFRARLERVPAGAVRHPGQGLLARGTPLVLLLHPWQLAGTPRRLEVTALGAAASAVVASDEASGPSGSEDEEDEPTDPDLLPPFAEDELPSDLAEPGETAGDTPGFAGFALDGDAAPGDEAADAERQARRKRRTGQPLAHSDRPRATGAASPSGRDPAGDTAAATRTTWQIVLPADLPAGQVVSIAVILPRRELGARDVALRGPHEEPLLTVRTRATRRRGTHLTARFVLGPPHERTYELDLRGAAGWIRPRAELYLWEPSG